MARSPRRGAYRDAMAFFAFDEPDRFYGEPDLAPGARVRFVPDKFFTARERTVGGPVDRQLRGDEGLLVHHVATDILVWPSSLWRVDDLARTVRPPVGGAWARCLAFTVVEEVPAWLVAGPHGYALEWVVAAARTLTPDQVDALGRLSDNREKALTKRLWARWSQGHARNGSPVGWTLMTVDTAVTEAARRVGPELFGPDEDDDTEVLSDPAWLRASSAAYSAALALGAPDLLTPEENRVLARRWTTVFGTPFQPE